MIGLLVLVLELELERELDVVGVGFEPARAVHIALRFLEISVWSKSICRLRFWRFYSLTSQEAICFLEKFDHKFTIDSHDSLNQNSKRCNKWWSVSSS